jgi:hypothetical protein
MIELNNIRQEGNIIYADVNTVETHPIFFKIGVDIKEEKIIENTKGTVDSYVAMALAKIINLSHEYKDKLPKKAESVWY